MSKEEIDEAVVRLKEKLLEICKHDRIKFGSNKFYEVQTAMMAGFIAATNEVPTLLGIALMSRRPIIDPYKLV